MENLNVSHELKSSEASEIKFIKKKGIKTERLALGSDETLKIAGMSTESFEGKNFISKLINKYRYVKVQDKEVYLNIGSIAQRLGISRKAAEKLANEGILYLEKAAEKHKKALEKYNHIINNFDSKREGLMLFESKHQSGLTAQTLLKSINIGLTLADDDTSNKTLFEHEYESHKFSFSKDFTEFHLIQKKIGIGEYGEIFPIIDLNKGIVQAQKTATKRTSWGEEVNISSLENESRVLKQIYKNNERTEDKSEHNELEGIQAPLSEIVHLESGNKAYYRTKLYSGNMKNSKFQSKFNKLPIEDKLNLCKQLFSGLKRVHSQRISHSDIKPENCFFESDPTTGNPIKVVIGDWGGSDKTTPTKTPNYTPNDNASYDYMASFDKNPEAKHDVFSLSKTVIETLLSKPIHNKFGLVESFDPCRIPLKKDSHEAKSLIKELEKRKVPEDIAELLVLGVCEHTVRPTASEIHTQLDNYVKNSANKIK